MFYLCNLIAIGFVSFFFVPEGHTYHSILSHQKLGVRQGFLQNFEIIGTHVLKGKDIEIFVTVDVGLNSLDNEGFMVSCFGLDFG